VVFRAALVPVSVGLMLATMVIISRASAHTPAAWVLLVASTAVMLWTRLNPLLLMFAGGVIGFFGLI
jgi:chromate transporter